MTTETPPETAEAEAPQTQPEAQPCPYCGADVRADQDWCLECGAPVAMSIIGPPSWRTPVIVISVLVLIAGIAVAVAFAKLSDDSKTVASLNSTTAATAAAPTASTPTASTPATSTGPTASTPTTPTPTTPTTPTTSTPTTPSGSEGENGAATPTTPSGTSTSPASPATPSTGSVTTWPSGKSAYTAILQSATSKTSAQATAQRLAGQGVSVGVLKSDDFSTLQPGYWVVFSGQFPAFAKAEATAQQLQKKGAPGAYARFVKSK